MDGGALYCERCGRAFEGPAVAKQVAAAAAQRSMCDLMLQRRDFSTARRQLTEVLDNFQPAGSGWPGGRTSPVPSSSALARRPKVTALPPLLHPMHVVLFNTHAALVNCARSERDFVPAVKHLQHMVKCMDVAYPENWPEKADFLFALAETLQALLETRKGSLPSRTAEGYVREMKDSFRKCHRIRQVCFGDDYPATAHVAVICRSLKV